MEACLLAYSWPGNVRQLQNVVRNVVVLHDGNVVTIDMLPALEDAIIMPAMIATAPEHPVAPPSPPQLVPKEINLNLPTTPDMIERLEVAERRYIENAIAVCGSNLQLAARRLGISASTIYRKKEAWEKA